MPNDSSQDSRRLYKVFVSSTYLDNKERRKIVRDAISMAGMVWHGMEIFTASTRPTVEECVRLAGEADVLVGIVSWRYGWEPEGEVKSITELEYDAAGERLMFQIDPSLPMIPEKDFDPAPDTWKKQEKLAAFKKRFSNNMPATFNDNNLSGKVLNALNNWREQKEGGNDARAIARRGREKTMVHENLDGVNVTKGGIFIKGDVQGDVVGRDKTVLFNQENQRVGAQYNIAGDMHQSPAPDKDDEEALRIYREVLARSCANVPMRGIDREISDAGSRENPLGLANVYIDLNTTAAKEKAGEEGGGLKGPGPGREERETIPL
ncbi:MAG: DUF4062 domain-containing protein, partial [Desulfobacterales bacterium]|nr:DUF4062 domain-containing protein [Desulfobacterales bacterium]